MVFQALVAYIDGKGKTNYYSKDNKKKAEQHFKTNYTNYTAFRDLEIPSETLNLQKVSTKKNENKKKKIDSNGER